MTKLITITDRQLENLFYELAQFLPTSYCPALRWLTEDECLSHVWEDLARNSPELVPHSVYGSNPFTSAYRELSACAVCHARSSFLKAGMPLPKRLPKALAMTAAEVKEALQ
ncbi:MAG: hypothetical protein DRI57_32245 [Deltaproteobacteria bacterium]|nr:MAG: hypothetical protein DRI57_32245 [Deltaproteobacteria bacterium]